jgi:hypothetical protein
MVSDEVSPLHGEHRAMSGPAPTGIVPPNFRSARLMGIFNVVFGAILITGGVCGAGYTLTLPLWGRVFSQITAQAEQQANAARKAELEAVKDQEKAAKTEKEKIETAARRIELENRPVVMMPGTMDFSKMGFTDPAFIAWTWTEVLSGIVLNLMMIVSGVGICHWKPGARRVGVWTAILKIVRLVLLWGFFVIAIVPSFARKMGEVVAQMMAQQPGMRMPGGVPPQEFFAQVYAITYSAMGVMFIVFGVIYPAIVLWVLTRPGVKSACSGLLKLPKEPNQPW